MKTGPGTGETLIGHSDFSLGHRKLSRMFHSEGHVPVKRADGHELTDESHQVDLSDGVVGAAVPQLSRLRPPLHRHL